METPKEKAKYLKKILPKSYKRYINIKILEHEDSNIAKTETVEYWQEVKLEINKLWKQKKELGVITVNIQANNSR